MQHKVKRELYERLDTTEGEKDMYCLVSQRDQSGKNVPHVRMIKYEDGNVGISEEKVLRRWKDYFKELMKMRCNEGWRR